jgi:hypothetical protein
MPPYSWKSALRTTVPIRLPEAEPDADDDGERQTDAVVVDALETGASELIDVRQTAHTSQPELCVEVHVLGEYFPRNARGRCT